MSVMSSFKRLVRFVPKSDLSKILIGQPVRDEIDVGATLRKKEQVQVDVFSGSSVINPGNATGRIEDIHALLSPLAKSEVGTIRCIGLNYKQHAAEAKMDIPTVPTLFMKPSSSLADPWPKSVVIPKISQETDSADYESELAIVIGKAAKNVKEDEALDYVLGYTASIDVSSRNPQFAQTQWCFSKSFDDSCPIGPTIVSKSLVPDVSKLHLRGLKNGRVMQDCGMNDLIFPVSKLVSFLSQGTTLEPGTLILTGTPAGVGGMIKPTEFLHHGDEFSVEILPHIGTLTNIFENEA